MQFVKEVNNTGQFLTFVVIDHLLLQNFNESNLQYSERDHLNLSKGCPHSVE